MGLRENADFVDSSPRFGGLVSGMIYYHSTFTCDEHSIRQAFDMTAERATMIHMHCAENRHEPGWCLEHYGKRPIEVYADWGVLGPRMLASQCVQITPEEVELLVANDVKAGHMPLSNGGFGCGIAPVPEMLSAGVTVGLGTDGYVNNYFALMRGALLVHRARLEDSGSMAARTVWRMATLGGAQALGLHDVGLLKLGFSADLVLIDADLPAPLTTGNFFDQLLLWRDPQHVDAVMCAGRWLVRDGEILGVDELAVRARCRQAAQVLWASA